MNLQDQLRLVAQRKIDKGETSVKLLAAKTGLTQSHVSNTLHAKRTLSIRAYETMLAALGFTAQIFPRAKL